jgi:hypothetical protein
MIKNRFLIMSTVVFGLFIFASQTLASSAELLQPAQTITYNEELVVNDTARFDSVYIGKQDVGGVTFFNGTIVNNTTTDDVDNPVTFGDNVRIDGILFRSDKEGSGYNMASLQSSGSSANVQNLEETNIVYDTINNADYGYFFNVGLGDTLNTMFYSLSIEYLYTEPN